MLINKMLIKFYICHTVIIIKLKKQMKINVEIFKKEEVLKKFIAQFRLFKEI